MVDLDRSVFILPHHQESKLLVSNQPGDQRLYEVLSEGLGNEVSGGCPRVLLLLPLPADLNRGPYD